MDDKIVIKLFIGILISYILVKYLKSIIKENRPIVGKSYGMPSSRSTVMAFILFFLLMNYDFKPNTKIILVILTLLTLSIKYYLKQHSLKQLVVGFILGIIISYIVNKCF
tara:strand:- start:3280 stop:3609 length:330 start_codon:yes stop_codon:yes gene_type:complete